MQGGCRIRRPDPDVAAVLDIEPVIGAKRPAFGNGKTSRGVIPQRIFIRPGPGAGIEDDLRLPACHVEGNLPVRAGGALELGDIGPADSPEDME